MEALEFEGFRLGTSAEPFFRFKVPQGCQDGNYYFLSNDVFYEPLRKNISGDYLFWGIANPHFFHVLSVIGRNRNLKRIIALDNNVEQVEHFCRLFHLIISTNDRIDFLQKLFKVEFNSKGKNLLSSLPPSRSGLVRGGVPNDKFAEIERKIWANCQFDSSGFSQEYHLKAVCEDLGLRIQSRTIGDINEYYATMICCGRKNYSAWPFTIGMGSGFLRDEKTFTQLQKILQNVPVCVLVGDAASLYSKIVLSHRYEKQVFWASNLFCNYFLSRHTPLKMMLNELETWGSQVEPHFPEVDLVVLQDQRERRKLVPQVENRSWRRRKLSVHSRNFRKLVQYIQGFNNIEVVNVPRWIEQDGGISKLPNTRYMVLEKFLKVSEGSRFDSIVLHILVGHGLPLEDMGQVLRKAKKMTDNLVIMEHYRKSIDFLLSGEGVTIDEIRSFLGKETILDFGPGKLGRKRNLIMIYRETSA